MEHRLINFVLLLNLIICIYSLIQNWNLENSSIDLLASDSSVSVKVFEERKNKMYVKLTKKIVKQYGSFLYTKHLIISNSVTSTTIFDGQVDFDDIESFHYFENDYIVCPKGKYYPTYFYDNAYSALSLANFQENGDWELKCIAHETGYFVVFFLMNGKSQFFHKKSGNYTWENKTLHEEIYDVKISPENSNYEYPLAYVVKNQNYIKFIGAKYSFTPYDGIMKNDCGGITSIMNALNNSRGCFEKNYDHFYFFTYTNISDFSSGYYDSSDSIDYVSVYQYTVNTNHESPLELADEVEIKEIKFIKNYKYAYYIIYNPTKEKTYYGIIDIKKNLVVFNTD